MTENILLDEDVQLEDCYELMSKDLEKDVKLPYIIKNKVLISPGVWNEYYYDPKEIQRAYDLTDWGKKETRSLFLDHEDLKSHEWIGDIKNINQKGDTLYGDLYVVDKATAIKLDYGAKFGISPKVRGLGENGSMKNYMYENFSIVINPAVKTAYINNSEVNKMAEDEIVKQEPEKQPEKPVEKPVEEPKEEKPEELSEDEVIEMMSEFDIAELSAWTDFVKKMRKKDPKMSFKAIAKAFKKEKKMADEKLAEEQKKHPYKSLSENDLIEMTEKILEELKNRKKPEEEEEQEKRKKKYPYPEKMEEDVEDKKKKPEEEKVSKMSETIKELNDKIGEIEHRLDKPQPRESSPAVGLPQNSDVDSSFMNYLKGGNVK